jgi:hypothetical protein
MWRQNLLTYIHGLGQIVRLRHFRKQVVVAIPDKSKHFRQLEIDTNPSLPVNVVVVFEGARFEREL